MRYLGSNILVSPENRTHGTLVLSAAIIAACDSANTSRDLYPMAYTSTLADDFSGVIAHRYTSGTCVVNATHFAVGAFLSSGIELQSDMLFAVSCSASFVPASGSTAIVFRPFFGRTVNSSVTVSTAAASNQTTNYIHLPAQVLAGNYLAYQSQIIGAYDSTNSNPFVFGIDCQCNGGTDSSGVLDMTIQIRRFSNSSIRLNQGKLL